MLCAAVILYAASASGVTHAQDGAQNNAEPPANSGFATPPTDQPLVDGQNPLLAPFAPDAGQEQLLQLDNLKDLIVDARLAVDGDPIEGGLVWRVFATQPGEDGTLPLLASAEGGTSTFTLAPGDYLIHAAFGRASIARRVKVTDTGKRESFVIEAGGLVLSATIDDQPLKSTSLRFDIFNDVEDVRGERTLIARNVAADQVIRLNQGTYHVVSRYGRLNSEVRADLRVEAGQLTKASLEQRGARVEFKLVSAPGGEAIADTKWVIETESREELMQSTSAQPSAILAEGNYWAVAQNKGEILQRSFKVEAGQDTIVELLVE